MPSGGYRPGAGRPKKALADKVLEGNPGKRELKVVQFDGPQTPGAELATHGSPPCKKSCREGGPLRLLTGNVHQLTE